MKQETGKALNLLMRSGRIEQEEGGEFRVRYTAIDPADDCIARGCQRPECWTRDLRPLREHLKVLIHAIASFETIGLVDDGRHSWSGSLYFLQMAASIEDVFADPSYIDDSESAIWCEAAWEYDEEQREYTSKYVAALTIFNFTWIAYEASIEGALDTSQSKEKLPVQARKFFRLYGQGHEQFAHFWPSFRLASDICSRQCKLESEINEISSKYELSGFAAAAELVRIFRNYIVHGRDGTPLSSDSICVDHFYAVARLLLLLIQALVYFNLRGRDRLILQDVIGEDERGVRADWLIANLHRVNSLSFEEKRS